MNNNIYKILGALGIIQLVFMILKVTNVINWNWIFVLIPAFASAAFVLLIVITVILLYLAYNR